jgi:hypothetical protein
MIGAVVALNGILNEEAQSQRFLQWWFLKKERLLGGFRNIYFEILCSILM